MITENTITIGMSAAADTPSTPKTYIAPGFIEFRLVLRLGEAWVSVTFKGGRIGGYGDYQAIFTTSDPVLQYMIEQSPDFKCKRIKDVK